MQLIRCLLSYFYLNMSRASLCLSLGEQDLVILHMVFCTGCVELGRKLCAHSLRQPANQCRIPHAVIQGLVLLMMGIAMPETCWDRSLTMNIGLVASCWFISLHLILDVKHEGRLHHHENGEDIQLLNNTGIMRRKKKKKTFWVSLSDSAKAETVLAQVLV
jgi:hypothetical protein